MSTSIYLINPRSDFPTYFGAEVYAASGLEPATLIADLALPTFAALAPASVDVRLCDENITPVDFTMKPDFVGLTGKITQHGRMIAIAREFRRRGVPVLIGGPYASLSPEALRPHADVLVCGEIEEIAADLFADLANGTWKHEYIGGRPDLALSPAAKWDGYPNHRARTGTIQTSRGCPFECEFCDVIQYLGRKQRHKPIANVLRELEELYRRGYRNIFLADDNFTASRSRAKELLLALRAWNAARDRGHVSFVTQVSIDAAKDEELLQMCADAGLDLVFIGIETPNESALKETKKRQNVGIDLSDRIGRFLDHGIGVTGGMIVGFDSDGPDIFERQYHFGMAAPVPIFSLGALVAPAATPLHARMEREGRLVDNGAEVAAVPWTTNIVPKQMSNEDLLWGLKGLCNRLYHPDAFGERVCHFIGRYSKGQARKAAVTRTAPAPARRIDDDALKLIGRLWQMGPAEARMCARIQKEIAAHPVSKPFVMSVLAQYMQIRHMYQYGRVWAPHLAA